MQGRTLGELMTRRERLATKAAGQANLLPYQLRAAALKGGATSDAGNLLSTAGSMYTARGTGGQQQGQGDPGHQSAGLWSANATDGQAGSNTYIDPQTGQLMARV